MDSAFGAEGPAWPISNNKIKAGLKEEGSWGG
jgi:hypothetical protein